MKHSTAALAVPGSRPFEMEIFPIIYALVGSVQYTCPIVLLCIVDASLSHYVGN